MAIDPQPPPAWTAADPAALREALAEAKASAQLPGPSFGEYLFDLGRWLQERVFGALGRMLPWAGLSLVEQVAFYAAVGAAGLALLAVVMVAVRRFRVRRPPGLVATPLPGVSPLPPTGDAAWWQGELARRLAAGALRPALEAAWWWTARRLDPPGLDPTWTTGQLLRARGAGALRAPALREPLRRLDRLLWGGGAPRRDEVEAVVAELGGAGP